jgi:excisionase family DNA binding protein
LTSKNNQRQGERPVQLEVTREWVTYKEAEQMVGLSRTTLRKLISTGEIEIRRVGRAVRISRASLIAYMNGETERSTAGVSE